MFKEKENKWTRERSYFEVHGPELFTLATAAFFLLLTLGGIGFVLFQPRIQGLHELFSDPPPAPPPDQKLHLAPGEQEMMLFKKPVPPPAPAKK